ncbi:MAG: hypothetical protein ACOC56_03930 [Atribacterota bacterium]
MKIGLNKEVLERMRNDLKRIKKNLTKERKEGLMYENMGQREIGNFKDKFRDYEYFEEADKIFNELKEFVDNLHLIKSKE